MQITPTDIPDVLIITPKVFEDERGFFYESFNARNYADAGINLPFVQDNHSRSRQGVLRGLHYQLQHTQGKLVEVVSGEVFDVVVDIRRSLSTFGKWTGIVLSSDNKRQVWAPPGFAHGFYVLSAWADFRYKTTDYYAPEWERTILWNDPTLGINWPLIDRKEPIISVKDALGKSFKEVEWLD